MHQSVHHFLLFPYHEVMCSLFFFSSVLLVYHPRYLIFLLCLHQLLVDSMPLVWREWEHMAMMSHTTSMPSTCITCTGWSIKGWRWLFPCWEQLVSVLESLCTQSYSSRRRLPQVEMMPLVADILETYFQQHFVKLKAWTSFYLCCCLILHFLTISCNLVSCDLV